MKKIDLENFDRIYFSGICGVSMSALCKHALSLGKIVEGSDANLSAYDWGISKLGVKINPSGDDKFLKKFSPQLVVKTSAVSQTDAEIIYANENNITVIERSDMLGNILSSFPKSIGISGCHGKTTTTAMISRVLIEGGLDPTIFLGGEDQLYGNYKKGAGNLVIAEACEYKQSFLSLSPTLAVVLNVDNDHLDCYKDMNHLVDSFKTFISGRLNIVNADDEYYLKIFNQTTVSFGIKNRAAFMAKNIRTESGRLIFDVYLNNLKQQTIQLNLLGKHNVYNALSAYAVGYLNGVCPIDIKKGLQGFYGVSRRMEKLGEYRGIDFYADYAHHPTELNAVLKCVKCLEGKTLVVFQPHTYSRTRILMKEFVKVLSGLENLIIYNSYPAREVYDEQGSSKALVSNLNKALCKAQHVESQDELSDIIKQRLCGIKRVIFLGAGDIYFIAKKILHKKNKKE